MKFTQFPVDGAVTLITGGARGIGYAIAERLVSRGARVVIADLNEVDAKEAAARLGHDATGIELDVRARDRYEAAVDLIETTIGPIDIVVNNAGIMPVGPILDDAPGVAEATMDVNFWAHHHSFRILAPRMVGRGRGHFINVTSAAGAIHSPGLAVYVASKHAATGFARSAREELQGTGVTISVVMPSAVRTELVSGIPFKGWERLGIVSPEMVARRAVSTLRRRPAVVGVPRGTVPVLRIYHVVPEWAWLLGRRVVGADRTLEPYDKRARAAYDSRIEQQAVGNGER
ncbi:putative oxidoreductase [Gordonia araii NBRC 100433]|uniref:Putative oxidoreductase n=1 Tax=Gordonia araii NBRC 100433 TaxID=1073574 RepID=G7GY00_9ACTN|nr:SDR family NAD(P)-dependent oxidoreductase [Gordonia araii]NNG98086.1 SDR family NAD(P)-dependent oxidoreductase [Gordonia araii NBRC 100433]GAB08475.1 putative oxidoreductase [Gordonia araii NBRC 100433]